MIPMILKMQVLYRHGCEYDALLDFDSITKVVSALPLTWSFPFHTQTA